MDEYVKEHGFAGWFETSAKDNINIEEAARALVNKVRNLIILHCFPSVINCFYFFTVAQSIDSVK